jgi:ectoine hydroxylase-related dioxygenase (phytanoyl-CoA dioxygenase family)
LYIQANDQLTFEQEKKFLLRIIPDSYNEHNSEVFDVTSQTGDMVIFPSYLYHQVKENTTDEIRISLAFNTFIKGTVGNYENANELNI